MSAFHQLFYFVGVISAHLRKTDASQNCWRLLSAIFKLASFDVQSLITPQPKMTASQFLWKQKCFKLHNILIWWNLNGFTSFCHFGGIFFVTWFHDAKKKVLAKSNHKGVSPDTTKSCADVTYLYLQFWWRIIAAEFIYVYAYIYIYIMHC